MEAQGINVHPCLATVTYLSTNGGPTVILEKKVGGKFGPVSVAVRYSPLMLILSSAAFLLFFHV